MPEVAAQNWAQAAIVQLRAALEKAGMHGVPVPKPYEGSYVLFHRPGTSGEWGLFYWMDEHQQHFQWLSWDDVTAILEAAQQCSQQSGQWILDDFAQQFPELHEQGVFHFYMVRGLMVAMGWGQSPDPRVVMLD